jgi:DnaJ-class molecular chaperone
VRPGASAGEVRRAYLALAAAVHPDKASRALGAAAAAQLFALAGAAHAALGEAAARRAYDVKLLRRKYAGGETAAGGGAGASPGGPWARASASWYS